MKKKVMLIPSAGERVRDILFARGLTVTDLAKATGVARSTLYAFMYDGTDISSMRLAQICKYLKVSMDDIMGI